MLQTLADIAAEAGAAIMEIYATEFTADVKSDASPVTEADEQGEAIILKALKENFPNVPVLAEEAAAAGDRPVLGDLFFLVDPLDGTKEFINKNGEFTVNIALIENGAPTHGVVYAPAIDAMFLGGPEGALKLSLKPGDEPDLENAETIAARTAPAEGLVAVASRSHRSPETDEFLGTLTVAELISAGSSLKLCLIAEGKADVYPRLGRTMEWDIAAGQAVLEAAGGRVEVFGEDAPLRYGKEERGYDNPYFTAWGLRA
ncbi:MAG: 3'(2'),5'-bisphosphate nucleotidase CysQ [Pseudomonadota bacterium]